MLKQETLTTVAEKLYLVTKSRPELVNPLNELHASLLGEQKL